MSDVHGNAVEKDGLSGCATRPIYDKAGNRITSISRRYIKLIYLFSFFKGNKITLFLKVNLVANVYCLCNHDCYYGKNYECYHNLFTFLLISYPYVFFF